MWKAIKQRVILHNKHSPSGWVPQLLEIFTEQKEQFFIPNTANMVLPSERQSREQLQFISSRFTVGNRKSSQQELCWNKVEMSRG